MKKIVNWIVKNKKVILILLVIIVIICLICKTNKNRRIAENIARENAMRETEEQSMRSMQEDMMFETGNSVDDEIPRY